jgi:hypothetical protein
MVEAANCISDPRNEYLAMSVPRLQKTFMDYKFAFIGLLIDLNEIDPHTSLEISSTAATSHKERVARDPTYSGIF